MAGQLRRNPIVIIMGILVALWVVVAVLGLIVKGLFYLFVIGIAAVLITAGYGALKSRNRGSLNR